MKKIIIKDNFAFLYLSSDFYTKEAILSTINIYSDFLETTFKEIGKYFVLRLEKKTEDYDLSVLLDEMLNFILSEEYVAKAGEL